MRNNLRTLVLALVPMGLFAAPPVTGVEGTAHDLRSPA